MVEPGYLDYLEIFVSDYLSHCSFSWGWRDFLQFDEHTLDLLEEISILAKVEKAWGVGALVLVGFEH